MNPIPKIAATLALILAAPVAGQHPHIANYAVGFGPISPVWVTVPGEPDPLLMIVRAGTGLFVGFGNAEQTRSIGVKLTVVEWAVLGGPCAPAPIYLTSTNLWNADPSYGISPTTDVMPDFSGGLQRRVPAKPHLAEFVPINGSQGMTDLSITFQPTPSSPRSDCQVFLSAILVRVHIDMTTWWGYTGGSG